MSTSNSNAMDAYNISLKDAKTIFSANSKNKRLFSRHLPEVFYYGQLPQPLEKRSNLLFLETQKAKEQIRLDIGPLPLGVRSAKMLEKGQSLNYISKYRRKTIPKNHAYVKEQKAALQQ